MIAAQGFQDSRTRPSPVLALSCHPPRRKPSVLLSARLMAPGLQPHLPPLRPLCRGMPCLSLTKC